MKKLVFATNNMHKLEEITPLINTQFELISLLDIGCYEEIEESSDSIEGNALIKARFVNSNFGFDCFADDTGLEIDALGGKPGVYSARYAGEPTDFESNTNKVLLQLKGIKNRTARFRTVIALILKGQEYLFEGIAEGVILEEKRGDQGFGYDPIFLPLSYNQTFAEMPLAIKNKISHRAKAVSKLIAFLSNLK